MVQCLGHGHQSRGEGGGEGALQDLERVLI